MRIRSKNTYLSHTDRLAPLSPFPIDTDLGNVLQVERTLPFVKFCTNIGPGKESFPQSEEAKGPASKETVRKN